MFIDLPYDVSLLVISYLNLEDVCKLHLLNRSFRDFVETHSSDVYHQLAISYRFVSPGRSAEDTASLHSKTIGQEWIGGADTWKELF